jgi:hypothetical protein
MKRAFFSIFIFSFCALCVFPVPLENLVSPAHAARLRSSGEPLTETQLRNPAPRLLPMNNGLRQLVSGAMNALNPNMLVETLYLYKKPARFHTDSAVWDDGQRTGIFNQMLALSTLTGIQYFSSSRNTMRTFYEYSSIIDGPGTRNPLPDPVFARPPETLSIYARQKDLTFGDNVYRYDYTATGDAVFFTQENVTALSFGIITAIGRGSLRSVMAVIDCGDSILVYAVSMAKTLSVPGMGDRIGNSFSNRAEAVLNWFSRRLDSELFVQ